jgi:pimeloyl-ACP methyl ester carboxylesterase
MRIASVRWSPAAVNDRAGEDGIDVRTIAVGRQPLCVVTTRGPEGRPPLLLFNGIGANWQLAKPFLHALTNTAAITFDVPGIGGSPLPSLPYRPSTLARLAAGVVAQLGHRQVDVAGVSWGGGVAQQFAHQHGDTCRKLVLAATSPGAIMVPADPQWSGSSRHRGATSTTTTCAA